MGSKTILFLGLFLALFLFISSEVAARDLAAETSNSVDTSKAAETINAAAINVEKDRNDYGGGRGGGYPGRGGGGGGYPGRGGGGGGYPGRGGGGYCRRCCGRHGCRCCYAGEKADAEYQTKPNN